jgi:hypothetical protein
VRTHRIQDEREVRELDRRWNEAYCVHDRTHLEGVLAEDFVAMRRDGRTVPKTELIAMDAPATVSFSEFSISIFGLTAFTRGRIRVERFDGGFEQTFLRVYAKREGRWRAVAVQMAPVV